MAALAERIQKAAAHFDSAAPLDAGEARLADAERKLREAHDLYGRLLKSSHGGTYPARLARAKRHVERAEERLNSLRANPDVHANG
jgi:hypothetical protein